MRPGQGTGTEWFYVRGGQQLGPCELGVLYAEARLGRLREQDPVWKVGWDDWRQAGSVPEIFPVRPQGNYLALHWRGDLSLPMSFWINFVIGTLIALAVALLVAIISEAWNTGEPRAAPPSVLGFAVALLIAVTAWQVVGVWRSASRSPGNGNTGWGLAALGAVSLQAIHRLILGAFLVLVILLGPPPLPPELSPDTSEGTTPPAEISAAVPDSVPGVFPPLAGEPPKTVQTQRIDMSRDIVFRGEMTELAVNGFLRELDARLGVRNVHLYGSGGDFNAARRLAYRVWQRRLTTYVPVECLSACTYVFMAGTERLIADGAKLGFHAPSRAEEPVGKQRERALTGMLNYVREDMRAFGLPSAPGANGMGAPSGHIWRPTQHELLKSGIVTAVVRLDDLYGTRLPVPPRESWTINPASK